MSLPSLLPRGSAAFVRAALVLVLSLPAFADAPDLSMVPGSASMPPKPLVCPSPAAPGDIHAGYTAHLGLWIAPDGKVESAQFISGERAWRDACLAAVKAWTFEPVVCQGHPIRARVEVIFAQMGHDVQYNLSPLPNLPGELHQQDEWGLTAPLAVHDPDIVLPLVARATRGDVQAAFDYVVEADGHPDHFKLIAANSEESLRAFLDELTARIYRPGKVGDTAVAVEYKEALDVKSTDAIPAALVGLVSGTDPIYPYDRAIAGESGSATIKFTLAADGSVASVTVTDASERDFGDALATAAYAWRFDPDDAAKTPERTYSYDFQIDDMPGSATDLLGRLRKGVAFNHSMAGLDEKLRRLYSPALRYPPALLSAGVVGSAKIRFIIDRHGLVQLPRIVEASRPEFGWAAADWVGNMRFNPPTRHGVPEELELTVPVVFKVPPKQSAAPKAASS